MGSEISEHKRAAACVKCGTCQKICPVFEVVPEEASAARGKMALSEAVNQGHLAESDLYRKYLEKCLLCGACEEVCPNDVKTLSTMLAARENLAHNMGIKPGKRLILQQIVGDPRMLDLAMRTGRTFQGLVFKRIPSGSGIRRRVPLPLITQDRTLPNLAPTFFTDRFSGRVAVGEGPRVGVFAGCMTNYFYSLTGETMVDLLREVGASVYVPAEQVCCGMPALTGGARETARELAVQNLESFEKYELDNIVTGCASCGSNLKENYGALLEEAGVHEDRIEPFISRIQDINEFLHKHRKGPSVEETGERAAERTTDIKVTYHHPCHLGRLQGVKDEPLELIRSLPGVRYIPMADEHRCCGMGGSFSLENYDISREVNDRKITCIIETGADAVVTSCPACIMHIRDGLVRNGRGDIEVLHVTELLDRYSREGEEEEKACVGVSR